ncbi:MAG TPA: hypothetical protein VEJ68_03670 [Candidatus Bathyarchaeia archaeon]|nr:hypothetical protein [Candidatus Bathyarchaeia archaeon]
MPGNHIPEDGGLSPCEIQYLEKVDWTWKQLVPSQKSRIVYSVYDGTLRQGSGKHCFIAEAININKIKTPHDSHLLEKCIQFVSDIFYDGPSYDFLFDREITSHERKILDDIYYARIGNREYGYQRATELVRMYVTCQLIIAK